MYTFIITQFYINERKSPQELSLLKILTWRPSLTFQNASKLENISNWIASPSTYPYEKNNCNHAFPLLTSTSKNKLRFFLLESKWWISSRGYTSDSDYPFWYLQTLLIYVLPLISLICSYILPRCNIFTKIWLYNSKISNKLRACINYFLNTPLCWITQ